MNHAQREAVRLWVEHATGRPAIYDRAPSVGEPTAPRPPKPYSVLSFGTDESISNVVGRMRADGSGIRDLYQDHEIRIIVRCFGANEFDASDTMRTLGMRAGTLDTELRFVDAGIALMREGLALDSGAVRGAQWFGRAEREFVFGYTHHITENVGTIEAGSFEITAEEPARLIRVTFEV